MCENCWGRLLLTTRQHLQVNLFLLLGLIHYQNNWTELRTRLSLQSWCSSSSSSSFAAAAAASSTTCKEVNSPEELNVCVQSDYHFFKWFQHYLKVFRPNWKRFLKWLLRCLLTAAVAEFAVECSKLCSSLQSVINSTRNTHTTNELRLCVCVYVCVCVCLCVCWVYELTRTTCSEFELGLVLKVLLSLNSSPIVCAAFCFQFLFRTFAVYFSQRAFWFGVLAELCNCAIFLENKREIQTTVREIIGDKVANAYVFSSIK